MTVTDFFDFNSEYPQLILEFCAPYLDQGAKITRFEAVGPAGGNPCIWIEFPNEEMRQKFASEHGGE